MTMNRSKYLDCSPQQGIYPFSASGAKTGDKIVDTQGFERALIVCMSGAITVDAAFQLMHGDQSNLSDAAAVPDADLNGSEPTLLEATDNEIAVFEYKGNKRYLRLDTTGSTGLIAGCILLFSARHKPVPSV